MKNPFTTIFSWLAGKNSSLDTRYYLKHGTHWLGYTVKRKGQSEECFVIQAEGIDEAARKLMLYRPNNTLFISPTYFAMSFDKDWQDTKETLFLFRYNLEKHDDTNVQILYHVGAVYTDVLNDLWNEYGFKNVYNFETVGYFGGLI